MILDFKILFPGIMSFPMVDQWIELNPCSLLPDSAQISRYGSQRGLG